MSASMGFETTKHGAKLPWGDILLSAIAAVSWALIGMAGVAALGLHLLEADATASLGPMTAALVALGAGGAVTPSGDVSAFGLTGAQAATAIEITPLGVSLVGALLLSWFFLRSLRAAGVVVAPAELLVRAGAVVVLFVTMLGGLAWAGHDVITIDGGALGLDELPGGGGGGGLEIPGLGDVGDIGGLLPDQVGDLVDAQAAVGFTVDTVPTLLGGLGWSAGILLIALLASRRTPLPRGWEAVHRVVRPAVSALVTVLLVAVAAGLAAAAYASVGDAHPKRIAGAALLGAPNGTWLAIPLGLFVPWDGRATGPLTTFLPDPLDDLLSSERDQSVSLSRLAELDGRVWLLGIAAAMMMLLAGVLAAVRTPVRGPGALGLAGRCALRLGVVTALALPFLAWLTDVSVNASLSVFGVDAFGAGIELHGQLGTALLLGALWGAAAGATGALLARATGAAGRLAAPLAVRALGSTPGGGDGSGGGGWTPGEGGGSLTAGGGPLAAGGMGGYPGAPGRYRGGAGAVPGGSGAVSGGAGAVPGGAGAGSGGPGAVPGGAGAVPGGPGAGSGGPGAVPGGSGAGSGGSGAGSGGSGAGSGGSGAGSGGGASRAAPYPGAPGGAGGEVDGRSVGGAGGHPGSQGSEYPGAGREKGAGSSRGRSSGAGPGRGGAGPGDAGGESGPYTPGAPYRPPNPDTNPYLRVPEGLRQPEDARPSEAREPEDARPSEARGPGRPFPGGARPAPGAPAGQGRPLSGEPPAQRARPADDGQRGGAAPPGRDAWLARTGAPPHGGTRAPDDDGSVSGEQSDDSPPSGDDLYGAPTMVRPFEPPPRSPRRPGRGRRGGDEPSAPDDGPFPPPPPPPPPPGPPKRRG